MSVVSCITATALDASHVLSAVTLYRYRPISGAFPLSMVAISRPLFNASRARRGTLHSSIWRHAARPNTRSYYITPLHTLNCTEIPLLRPVTHNSHLPCQKQTRLQQQQRSPTRPQLRHCSHRRTMCRHQHEADVPGSSIDITQGREILPANVKPLHYHLTLEPNLETFDYKGTVVIE